MKKTVPAWIIIAALALAATGCGVRPDPGSGTPAVPQTAPPQVAGPGAETPPPQISGPGDASGRMDGECFETVIIMEGMEETVRCEHIRNDTLGFEADYEYERFTRRTGADRERFVSLWGDREDPENYLELTFRAKDAGTVAAAVIEDLSQTYDILQEDRELEHAGSCLYIEASVRKGTNNMADRLQLVYVIPAPGGCLVATEHLAAEAAEGFGRRFSCMLNTLAVFERQGGKTLSDEEALAAVRDHCYAENPDLERIVNAGEYPVYWEIASSEEREIVVLFRSYTGAELRYHIDRATGDTFVTEFIPGITAEEQRTEEEFNIWEYLP
ncbi:MAG: hypothetical protein IKO22_07245 [Oscillospiraceae bacterium]|nr:hypothetical protein [Oscillospiraceae bacterium]